jgi:hypothetical protein
MEEIMRRWVRRILLTVLAALVVAQFIPAGRTNPPVDPTQTILAKMATPPEVVTILNRACQDCHSNQTAWPWYSRIAPVSWLVVRDVTEGRRELNLSDWGRYVARRQDRKLKEICDQVQSGEMPMAVYTLVHPQAKLTASDRKALCDWAVAARKSSGRAATAGSSG